MNSTPPTLVVAGLRKAFRIPRPLSAVLRHPFGAETKEVLRGCSFSLPRGETAALVGPNGAGKTTLARILCGAVLPDSGSAALLCVDVSEPRARRRISLARPEDPVLHPRLTLAEALRFHLGLYGVRAPENFADFGEHRELAAALKIPELLSKRCAVLSAGEKARASLFKALMTRPELLIADELSRVLDPAMTLRVRQVLRGACGQGLTALIVTHDLSEASACGRVLVMAGGEVAADGPWHSVEASALSSFGLENAPSAAAEAPACGKLSAEIGEAG